jgi:hypothetical protein
MGSEAFMNNTTSNNNVTIGRLSGYNLNNDNNTFNGGQSGYSSSNTIETV